MVALSLRKTPLQITLTAFIVLFTSCHTSRSLERRQTDAAYRALRIEKSRKDNEVLIREAASWLGTPHREGGTTHKGIDCSGLVNVIYKKVYGKNLARISKEIMDKNCREKDKSSLKEGDLVFFNTAKGGHTQTNINHVGIYLKDDKFLHTSTSRGVMVSDLNEIYFQKAWVCGGRVK